MSAYDWAAKIGVIDLSTCTSLVADFGVAVPREVLVLYSRLRLPQGEVSVRALDEMLRGTRLEEAALELADAGVAAITFACTSGSLLHGPGFDRQVCGRITAATGLPATTTATAVLRALDGLAARSVCVGTPYDDEINEREQSFFQAQGVSVRHIVGLGIRYDRDIGELTLDQVRSLAHAAWQSEADALFLSCTNLPALTLVDELESLISRPVVTSNSATIWDLLWASSYCPERTHSLGRLARAPWPKAEPHGGDASGFTGCART